MINPSKDRSFHPKIWLIKYENDKGNVVYRMLVLSRNLTFDRSWDVTVGFDGKIASGASSKSEALSNFMKFLCDKVDNRTEKLGAKKRYLKKLSEEITKVEFELNDKRFDNYDFIPLGINEKYGKAYSGIFNTYHEMFMITPFLTLYFIFKYSAALYTIFVLSVGISAEFVVTFISLFTTLIVTVSNNATDCISITTS
jgi:hypothetical protein